MGKARFFYQNMIADESMITVSSLRDGIVTTTLKEGTGSASMSPSGAYTGAVDLEYTIEIDSIAGGAEVGQATFKWTDGLGAWNATGVTTAATAISLNNGVSIAFTSGSGADFVVGDKWYFKGINLFNASKMIDLDRDHRYRSAALGSPNTITINLGSAREVEAVILFDHNLTSGATILVDADDAATFDSGDGGAPQFSESIAWASEKILHYLSTAATKRYWRISITDAANTDAYIAVGEIFLGPYLELTRNYAEGYGDETQFLMDTNRTPYGIGKHRFYNAQRVFSFDFNDLTAADITSLRALIASVASRSLGTFNPFWMNIDSASASEFWLVEIESLPVQHRSVGFYNASLVLTEALTSV